MTKIAFTFHGIFGWTNGLTMWKSFQNKTQLDSTVNVLNHKTEIHTFTHSS